jgi:hypothetical protein
MPNGQARASRFYGEARRIEGGMVADKGLHGVLQAHARIATTRKSANTGLAGEASRS